MGNVQDELRKKWKSGMKEALHNAVVKVLAEDGLQGLTVDRITSAAGIGKGTVYNYFKDKSDLLQHVVRASMEPLEKEHAKLFASDLAPPQKLKTFVLVTLKFFDKNRAFFRVLLDQELSGPRMSRERKNHYRKLISNISGIFEDGIEGGFFRPAPPKKLAAMLMMSCASIARGRLWNEDFSPIEDDANLVIEVFFKGIGKGGCKK